MYAVIFELEGQLDCTLHATQTEAQAEASRLSEKYAAERANYSASVAVQGCVSLPQPYSEAPAMAAALREAIARILVANNEGDPILSAWLPEARAILARIDGEGATAEPAPPIGEAEIDPDDLADWQYEAFNGDTKLGFHAWLAARGED